MQVFKWTKPSILDDRGFILIITVIGIMLIGIVSSMVVVSVSASFKIVDEVQARKDIALDGSTSMNKFMREYCHLDSAQTIQIADVSKFRFSNSQGVTLDYEKNNSELTSLPLNSTDREKVSMVKLVLVLTNDPESIRFVDQVFPENLRF